MKNLCNRHEGYLAICEVGVCAAEETEVGSMR